MGANSLPSTSLQLIPCNRSLQAASSLQEGIAADSANVQAVRLASACTHFKLALR